ncbi:unnamed protein product [Dovyalis caffra]|uniref:Uncharacterized protein n=1 Tax=Dovyalis caffra TaxID=77055 RepID=A0AAV1QXU0_9ROSI|nr:unnamed protein product [Dovyalis caffra]
MSSTRMPDSLFWYCERRTRNEPTIITLAREYLFAGTNIETRAVSSIITNENRSDKPNGETFSKTLQTPEKSSPAPAMTERDGSARANFARSKSMKFGLPIGDYLKESLLECSPHTAVQLK